MTSVMTPEEVDIQIGDTSTMEAPATLTGAQEEQAVAAVDAQVRREVADHADQRMKLMQPEAMPQEEAGIEIAEPITPTGYPYWDLYTAGPYQFFRPITVGPVRPAKVIALGEAAYFYAVIWANPLPGPGGSISGTQYLGALNNYTVSWRTVDLERVQPGPRFDQSAAFGTGVAPQFRLHRWRMVPRQTGLYEFHLSVDFTTAGHPVAGFSTWHFDPDYEPAISRVRPALPPEWQHDIPMRFLVYEK